MNEGDYFRWRYKIPPKGGHEPYWCKSQIALFKNGVLVDTFWSSSPSHGSVWTETDAREKLVLTFVANLSELVEASPGVVEDHRPEDIVNLNHPNTRGGFYLRKGAKRDLAVQRATWEKKRDDAQRTADMYQGSIDRLDS